MEGPVRFQCPPEFEAVAPSPHPALQGGALGGPSTELWLIRAPADFCPESLEGCTVPLGGCRQLRPPGDGDSDGDRRFYGLRSILGGADNALLLAPDSPTGPLACAPRLRGCLTITESFGPPPAIPVTVPTAKRKKKKKKEEKKMMKEPLEVPEVSTPGRAVPSEGGERGPGPPQDIEVAPAEPELPKRKKKRKRERPE